MPPQYICYKLALPIEKHHQTYTVDWRKICLITILFFPCKMLCSVPQGPHQRQSEAGTFDHWCLPCTCCLTRLNCYIVTSGSAICNNVTSSAAMQVCKHGFTNLVSNVMSKWNFYYIIINISMLKLSLTWHMKFFNDFHWFSMTFPGKLPFFQVNIKFHDFSSQGLNSMTFPGLCEPCLSNSCRHKMSYQQGKSEGFESCDRPIVRKRPI